MGQTGGQAQQPFTPLLLGLLTARPKAARACCCNAPSHCLLAACWAQPYALQQPSLLPAAWRGSRGMVLPCTTTHPTTHPVYSRPQRTAPPTEGGQGSSNSWGPPHHSRHPPPCQPVMWSPAGCSRSCCQSPQAALRLCPPLPPTAASRGRACLSAPLRSTLPSLHTAALLPRPWAPAAAAAVL
jgi:hypothetical protein